MKRLLVIVLVAISITAVLAQQIPPSPPTPPPTTPPGSPPAAAPPAAPAPDPAAVAAGEKLIAEVARAYKTVKGLTDTITMKMESPEGQEERTMTIAVGSGQDASIAMPGITFTALEGKLYVVRDDVRDKYLVADLDLGGMHATAANVLGDGSFVPPQIAMRSEQTPQQQLDSAVMHILDNPKVAGHQMTQSDDGKQLHEVPLIAEAGSGAVLVDPETKFIHRVRIDLKPPHMPDDFAVKVTLSMSPKAHDSLPTPIAFSAGDRKAVMSMEQLEPTPIAEGQAAPDFTLPTLAGESVTLSELKGSAVVLDFWATWCGPCRMALPKLEEFAQWAASSGQPIKVYAVNVWERFKSPEETKTKVGDFWKSKSFTMATLLDLDNEVVGKYGFSSIPTTVIVGPDGKVFKIHRGFSEQMVEELKRETEEALKAGG